MLQVSTCALVYHRFQQATVEERVGRVVSI